LFTEVGYYESYQKTEGYQPEGGKQKTHSQKYCVICQTLGANHSLFRVAINEIIYNQ